MTDQETLFRYRLGEAEETLEDVKTMLRNNITPRSILNRAYYVMFYAILALFLKKNVSIKTSKHIGIISIFDREFVHTGEIDRYYSKILHKLFDKRQKGDYREFVMVSVEDATEAVNLADEFLRVIKEYVGEKE